MAGMDGEALFGKVYASAYDALCAQKDYERETTFIEACLRRFSARPVHALVDWGCGTGGHAIPLARRGYAVTGVDRSAAMLEIARTKAGEAGVAERTQLIEGDIRTAEAPGSFDAGICMFAVIGYMTSNDDLLAALRNARRHLRTGGLYLCDFWHGPAVLAQRPEARTKTVEADGEQVTRRTTSTLHLLRNVVEVRFDIARRRPDGVIAQTQEIHTVRFFFKPEMELAMQSAGLKLLHFCPFPEIDGVADECAWNVAAVAQAV